MRHLAACLALLLPLAACSTSHEARIDVPVAAAAAPSGNLLVTSRNGSIAIEVDPLRHDVLVEASIRMHGGSQAEAAARAAAVTFVATQRDGRLEIEPNVPDGWRGSDAVSMRVVAPALHDVVATTSNGALRVAGATGTVRLKSSNGRIEASDVKGAVDARTSNGRVEILRAGAAVVARSSNGPIAVDAAPGPIDAETSNGALTLTNVGGPIEAATSNGSVTLAVRPDFAGTLELTTSNGKVEVDAVVATRSISSERGRATIDFTAPGTPSHVRTSNGRVTVTSASAGAAAAPPSASPR